MRRNWLPSRLPTALRLPRVPQPEVIIEVGCWLGLTTTLLCEESAVHGAAVFAIDRWDAAYCLGHLAEQYRADARGGAGGEAAAILEST